MAEFKIDGRMKVKKLKELFKDEYQGTLRVYNGGKLADEEATLASIRNNDGAKGGTLTCRASRTVGKFIEDMWETFGIKIKVASPDDWVLALDGITLSKLKDIPNNAKKSDMEALIAYKRGDKDSNENGIISKVRIMAPVSRKNSSWACPASSPSDSMPVSNKTIMEKAIIQRSANSMICLMRSWLISFICGQLFPVNKIRLAMERPNVTSSAYSSSSPTEIPRAMMLNFTL